MVEIECLVCEKIINIPNYIDTEKYEGQMVCQECKSILYVKLVKGKVQKYKVLENKYGVQTWADIVKMAEKAEKQQEESGRG